MAVQILCSLVLWGTPASDLPRQHASALPMMRISDSSCESSDSGDPEEDRLSVDTDEL